MKMNFTNNKKKKNLLAETAYIMRKRWRRKSVKRKHQYWVRDIFADETDSQYNKFLRKLRRVRLNYATTHHHPPPAKIYTPPPTTTDQQPKYIHHHPPSAKLYPPPPTTSQRKDHHPAKAKIYSYIISFLHCFNSFFFFGM